MWAHLNQQGIPVTRCTVERLMRRNGWVGATRARRVVTTVSDPDAGWAPDLVDRQFNVSAPNVLFVADCTYVPMVSGVFGYTALVVDAFAGTVVGWECSTSKVTAFVDRAIRGAVAKRRREGNPLPGNTIHHSMRVRSTPACISVRRWPWRGCDLRSAASATLSITLSLRRR
jgi:putative transposase